MLLFIDNFDSFTYNLVDYFEQCGQKCEVLRNDVAPENINLTKYKGMVISPGPSSPSHAGNLLKIINKAHDKLPILGICLGHQALGEYFGATVTHAVTPMHGKPSAVVHTGHPLFDGIPKKISVIRYHSLIISALTNQLTPIAFTNKDEIMAFQHFSLPITGIQFHPESILTEYGIDLIQNWLNINHIES